MGTIAGVVGFLIVCILMFVCYKKVPSNKLLIKYGLGIKGTVIKRGGGAFIIPYFQGIKTIDLGLMNTDIKLNDVLSLDKISSNLLADATFKVSSNDNEQKIVAEALISSTPEQIAKIAQEIISGELRSAIANLTIDEINTSREKLKEKAEKNIELELSKIGLDLKNLNLKSINDNQGVLETMGRKSASEINNKAIVDVAEQERFGRTESAKLETETVIAEKNAEVKRQEATLDASQQMKQKEIETTRNVTLSKAEADKETSIKIEENRQQILAQKTASATKEAELKLEEKRAAEIVDKKIENEKEILDNETVLIINTAKAENELVIASKKAEAVTIAAKAESDAIKMKAEAQAELLALPKIREAEAVAKLNEALAGQPKEITDYLLKLELIKVMPQITMAEAEAFKNIKFKDITVFAGGTGTDGTTGNPIQKTVQDMMGLAPVITMGLSMIKELFPQENTKSVNTIAEKHECN